MGKVREMKADEGFNALTEKYENLVDAGVIDPTKVVRYALQNAASIASPAHHRGHHLRDPGGQGRERRRRDAGGGGGMY